jgi:hypothetical protein
MTAQSAAATYHPVIEVFAGVHAHVTGERFGARLFDTETLEFQTRHGRMGLALIGARCNGWMSVAA